MIPELRLDAPQIRQKVDALRLREIHLLYPPDASGGGLIRVLEVDGGALVGERTIVLTAEDVEAARDALGAWVEATLRGHNQIDPGRTATMTGVAPIVAVPPTPAGGDFGALR